MLGEFHSDISVWRLSSSGDVFLVFTGAVALISLSSMLCFVIISLLL